jgi:hypothetical protein
VVFAPPLPGALFVEAGGFGPPFFVCGPGGFALEQRFHGAPVAAEFKDFVALSLFEGAVVPQGIAAGFDFAAHTDQVAGASVEHDGVDDLAVVGDVEREHRVEAIARLLEQAVAFEGIAAGLCQAEFLHALQASAIGGELAEALHVAGHQAASSV